jgi:DedD protein
MDKALKQRLVGATVLIILTVIILPMLLSGRSDTLKQGSSQIEIPDKPEELSISKRRFPVGVPDQPTAELSDPVVETEPDILAGDMAETSEIVSIDEEFGSLGQEAQGQGQILEAVSDDSPEQNPDMDNVEPVSAEEVAIVAIPEKAPAVTTVIVPNDPDNVDLTVTEDQAGSDSPRYLVQVASFSSEKRADLLAAELRGAGMKVTVDEVDRTAGRLHRVRVGPYAERTDADDAITKIKTFNSSLGPRLVDLRPADSAPVSTPSDPLVRWVVQVGSFSTAEAADAQVAKLRLAGLPAYAEKITSNNMSVYKVRVGPEVNRDKATELAKKLKTEQQLDGFVTTQE